MKDKFFIISGNSYPNGDAGAIRQHAFAKIFWSLGYTPIVIGMGKSNNFTKAKYDNIDYYSLRYSSKNILFRLLGRVLFECNVKKILKKYATSEIRGILYVSGSNNLFEYIKKWAKKNDIHVFHDSVEWYSPCEFKKGDKALAYRINNKLNTVIVDEFVNVFAISRYLEDEFCKRNIRTMRMPVIMDVNEIKCEKHITDNKIIKIIYAGQVGNKDHLGEIVRAIELLDINLVKNIQLRLIGITQEQYEKVFGVVRKDLLGTSICFLGRIPRENVLSELQKAHFTVLLRPENERYSKAGFPTKVVESLSSGTPVICNLTSDLELYLENNYNSIVIEQCTVESCRKGLEHILELTDIEIENMQKNARRSAEENFDWHLYINSVNEFICNS